MVQSSPPWGVASGSTIASGGTELVASGGINIGVTEEREPHHGSQPQASGERVGKEARRAAPARYPVHRRGRKNVYLFAPTEVERELIATHYVRIRRTAVSPPNRSS